MTAASWPLNNWQVCLFFWTMLEISTECEINAGFFKCVLPDDLMVLVMVMLYDLQDRKFQPRELLAGEQEGPIEV